MTSAIEQFDRRHPVLFGIVGALIIGAALLLVTAHGG